MAVQTPQFFDSFLAKSDAKNKPSDDLFFVANKKTPIRWVKGEKNIKITTANDLELAKFYSQKTILTKMNNL